MSTRHSINLRLAAAVAAAFAAHSALAADKSVSEKTEAPRVDVISTTPLPSLGTAKEEIAAPVQTATSRDLDRSQASDLTDFMNRNLGGVHINDVQNNPVQPDVSYRGFTLSPLLGNPQGLSVYMDGVRMNQALGDQISWDLIPRSAISTISLMPGSNPLFGLNTLGGALSIQTKNGRTHGGTRGQAYYGDYSRRAVEFEHGGSNDKGLDWFITANDFRDDGWRDFSPTRVQQVFGKMGWANAATDIDLTWSFANNNLIGNGFTPIEFLRTQGYSSIFTRPDQTQNNSNFLNLALKHQFNDNVLFSANTYYRRIKTRTLNGDGNDNQLEVEVEDGEREVEDFDESRAATVAMIDDDDALDALSSCGTSGLLNGDPLLARELCNGTLNRTRARQHNAGLQGQFTFLGNLFGQRNQFIVGAGYDVSRVNFGQTTQFGVLDSTRGVEGLDGLFDADAAAGLSGKTRTYSVFATDTLSIQEQWHLTLSGRYNHTRVDNRDLLMPGPGGPGTGSLTGDHKFSRFNPAVGLTWTPNSWINPYVGYNEGSRAPSTIELGCADPAFPCRLPNALAGDPPLNQVVTKTYEGGLRGKLMDGQLAWNAGLFNATNQDDILFIATGLGGLGYFENFGKTRRRGAEFGLSGSFGNLRFGSSYTYVDATFENATELPGENNSARAPCSFDEDEDCIAVRKGNRIPQIPRHQGKFFADYQVSPKFGVGTDVIALSSMFVRGNENNAHRTGEFVNDDEKTSIGKGETSAWAIVNLRATYQLTDEIQLFGRVNNVFDREYFNGGVLAENRFNAAGQFTGVEQPTTGFAPGAPRIFWFGLRFDLEGSAAKRSAAMFDR
jgi:outer membrane receptor protein involved in Fe transport